MSQLACQNYQAFLFEIPSKTSILIPTLLFPHVNQNISLEERILNDLKISDATISKYGATDDFFLHSCLLLSKKKRRTSLTPCCQNLVCPVLLSNLSHEYYLVTIILFFFLQKILIYPFFFFLHPCRANINRFLIASCEHILAGLYWWEVGGEGKVREGNLKVCESFFFRVEKRANNLRKGLGTLIVGVVLQAIGGDVFWD